ncbi:MAG: hypothetical protein IPI39_23815 [Candidatus Obscuribacter sp.]|jgi:hypothetical protein|nr:hypothetical protein [Candidatus Obscuribacter sp.]MBK7837172.1 hypothetical protein [Candidatus Obscuribacter sp.]
MRIANSLIYFVILLVSLAVLVYAPVFAIIRPMPQGFLQNWDFCAYALISFTFLSKGWQKRRYFVGPKLTKKQIAGISSAALYLGLYVMASLLCRRLKLGLISPHDLFFLSPVGLVLLLIACRIIIKGADGPLGGAVRYPVCTGLLLAMSAFPLVQLAWFPLLAIPGILTLMAWRISYLEKTNIETGSLSGFHVDFLPDSVPAAPEVEKAELSAIDSAKDSALAASESIKISEVDSAQQPKPQDSVLIEVIEPADGEAIAVVQLPKYRVVPLIY